ncbi:cytochrome c [Chitinophaga sp. HK235]|uniref:c-type cytochrome n=1 Tax=Chitinophaga sp. HK235 TaxID=2952571 RepID=UPI001BA4A8B3|nr:cytochrome c [Chitinophaga sp. HK235]
MAKENTPTLFFPAISLFLFIFLSFNTISAAQTPKWQAPKEARDKKNPLEANSSNLVTGRSLYMANCVPCHGNKGRGDGPSAAGLNPKPADHTSAVVQSETDGSLFWKIGEGHSPMPSFKKTFTDEQRWALVIYIRSLAKTAK